MALQKTGDYSLKTLPAGSTITYGGSAALDLSELRHLRAARAERRCSRRREDRDHELRAERRRAVHDLRPHRQRPQQRRLGRARDPQRPDDQQQRRHHRPVRLLHRLADIGSDNPAAISDSTDPVLHGPFGTVTGASSRSGTTVTLKPADNADVKGLLYRTGYSGNTGAFFATSTFGSGRVAIWGDSSPIDDGTGQSGNTLYDGWNDPAGTNAALALNATEWLVRRQRRRQAADGGGTCTAAQLLGNPGFESGSTSWTASSG